MFLLDIVLPRGHSYREPFFNFLPVFPAIFFIGASASKNQTAAAGDGFKLRSNSFSFVGSFYHACPCHLLSKARPVQPCVHAPLFAAAQEMNQRTKKSQACGDHVRFDDRQSVERSFDGHTIGVLGWASHLRIFFTRRMRRDFVRSYTLCLMCGVQSQATGTRQVLYL